MSEAPEKESKTEEATSQKLSKAHEKGDGAKTMDLGPFAVLAEPTPPWIAVPSLFLFTAAILFLSARYARRMEISYAGD